MSTVAASKAALTRRLEYEHRKTTAFAGQTNNLIRQVQAAKARATAAKRANVTKRLSSLRRKLQAHRNAQGAFIRRIEHRLGTLRNSRRNRR